MLDSFDHGREEGEPGDERTSLLGENDEGDGEECKSGEQEGEFWDRSCSEESMMSEVGSRELVLQNNKGSLLLVSLQESTMGTIGGEDDMRIIKWQCDIPGCGRWFPKRNELKQVLPLRSSHKLKSHPISPSTNTNLQIVVTRNTMSNRSSAPNQLV